MKMNYKLKKISGDASFREFYRVKNNKTSIIVFAKKEQFKNLFYSVVNNILNNHNIQSPKLNDYYKNNMIEITDLEINLFLKILKSKKNKLSDYKKLVDLIIKLQKIKLKKNIILEEKQSNSASTL